MVAARSAGPLYQAEQLPTIRENPYSSSSIRRADCRIPGGFLHRAFKLGELAFENLPPTQALFNHFANVNRWADLPFVQHGLDSGAAANVNANNAGNGEGKLAPLLTL